MISLVIEIDNEETFKECLKNGINLFTGAGFSILPDVEGKELPLGNEYAKELSEHFGLKKQYVDLDRLSNLLPQEALQDYTRRRFKVSTINELYYQVNKLNLHSYITTNYDNIPYLINKCNSRQKIYDATKGPQMVPELVPFVSIHGDVSNEQREIVIGSMAVSLQNRYNSDAIKLASVYFNEAPTLVWGYRLVDSSSLQVINDVARNRTQSVWILCYSKEDNEDDIDYYRSLGFNVIIGDTKALLEWIRDNVSDHVKKEPLIRDGLLEKYRVNKDVDAMRRYEPEDYFKTGITAWYHIYKNVAYERSIVKEIYEKALLKKHVVIKGSNYSGKTTILMQVSKMVSDPNIFFFNDLTLEMADLFLSRIEDNNVWMFIDDCISPQLYTYVASYENVTLVATMSDLIFESERYHFGEIEYECFDITELENRVESQHIYEKIPKKLRKNDEFQYKDDDDEKYSMMELIAKNIKGSLSDKLIKKVLLSISEKDQESIDIIALTVYLSWRGSALTTDVLMGYFDITNYETVRSMINKVNNLLREISTVPILGFEDELDDQDYYRMRSGLFLTRAESLFERQKGDERLKAIYARVVKRLIMNVIPLRIWRYDEFRKKEYDSELFFNIFSQEEADELYRDMYDYSKNPFVLQQWALYHRRCGRFKEAYDEISSVMSKNPNNPSIQNSYAMILFEMNRDENDEESVAKMRKAMEILERLHYKDVRKKYHTEKYSDYAIYLSKKLQINDYLSKALSWLEELDEPTSPHIKENMKIIKSMSG